MGAAVCLPCCLCKENLPAFPQLSNSPDPHVLQARKPNKPRAGAVGQGVFSVSSLGLGSVTFPTESVRAVGKVENQAGSLGYSVPSRAERWTSTKFPALADPESKALDSETL